MNISCFLLRNVRKYPARQAIVPEEEVLASQELNEAVKQFAPSLHQRCIGLENKMLFIHAQHEGNSDKS